MLTDQHFFWPQRGTNGESQVPLQTSAEFLRSYKKQAHETIDAMTAVVINAQAALNWLRAQPQDLEGVQQALNNIVNNGKRAGEIVARLRELVKKVPTADGPDPRADCSEVV